MNYGISEEYRGTINVQSGICGTSFLSASLFRLLGRESFFMMKTSRPIFFSHLLSNI